MKAEEIIFVVRKPAEAELLKGLHTAPGIQVRVHVLGALGAMTLDALRRLRRSANAQKRRTPVVVWAANTADAETWRAAGALAIVGVAKLKAAEKALTAARAVPWVESAGYVGPDRRHKKTWLGRTRQRLADSAAAPREANAKADTQALDTRLRQLRFAAFGVAQADRARRAQFLADVRAAAAAAERARRMHAAAACESLARYLAARGAKAPLDQALIDKHLEAADAQPAEAAVLVGRLQRAVDRALGLAQPG
jgi:hypothetical protein